MSLASPTLEQPLLRVTDEHSPYWPTGFELTEFGRAVLDGDERHLTANLWLGGILLDRGLGRTK